MSEEQKPAEGTVTTPEAPTAENTPATEPASPAPTATEAPAPTATEASAPTATEAPASGEEVQTPAASESAPAQAASGDDGPKDSKTPTEGKGADGKGADGKGADGKGAEGKPKKKRPNRNRASNAPRLHKGKVTQVAEGMVHIEFGPKVHGIIAESEFTTVPDVGAEHEFSWISIEDGIWKLDRTEERNRELWKSLEPGKRVEARVVGENTGGLDLRVGSIAAFMPGSQIGLDNVKDKKELFGQSLECEVIEVNRKRRRVVLSRRVILARAADEKRAEAMKTIAEGQVVQGKVRRLEAFGAIVEFGEGLSGLVHVSNLSHHRVNRPSDVLKVGQELEVKILEIKSEGRKIGLGLKQLQSDPWETIAERFKVNSRHTGKVVRAADFGAFIELDKGIEGLAHISELSKDRIDKVSDAVKEGEEVLVRVLSVDRSRKRISLSRLNGGGEMLGSDDDSEDDDVLVEDFRSPPAETERGTNLGDVLRRALEGGS